MNSGLGQVIGGRYKIIRQLGQGGFGTTFVAQDQHLPDDRYCVVKQLKPQATDPFTLQTARRLFETEAKMLHQLGTHEQIPQLFAYFEENQEFYLVQELIEGDDLSQELISGTPLSEGRVILLLRGILEILDYVHQHKVIHRDINPRNIIRRKQDSKLVLIDFGAVKQVSTQIIPGKHTSFTVAIGTPGYRPSEQANGNPRLSSDIYAVGMVGITALTGLLPQELPIDPDTGEINWQDRAKVSPEFAKILDKMVRYDFRERYSSADSALQALNDLGKTPNATVALPPASPPPPPVTPSQPAKPILYKVLIFLGVLGFGSAVTVAAVNWINSNNATDLYQRGQTLLELKRYGDALNAYNRAIKIRPEYVEAWQGQADSLLALKRYEDALDAFDKAIQIQPDYRAAWKGRGDALEQLGRYEEAINAFDSAIKISADDLEVWESRANVQIKLQRYSAAIASLDKALEIQPEYSPAWYRRGWALHNLRQYQDAIKSYDNALKYKPDASEYWYQRGNALMNLQKYREAVESYDQAVQFKPNFYQAWYSRGSALNNLRQYPEALDSFKEALKFQPSASQAWYGQGWALHQLQRYEEAVNAYDKAIKFNRKSDSAWYNRGNVLYNLKRYQQAIASYNQAVAIKPDYYEAWYSRGNALFNLQLYAEAIASYEKALRYKPNYQEASSAKQLSQRELDLLQNQQQQVEQQKPEQR